MSVTAYIALGSNLGEREKHLDQAVGLLRHTKGIEVVQVSSYYETEPVGGPPGQGKFLNAAAELSTILDPDDLLRALHFIEVSLGRVRKELNGPRTVDLDLLLFRELIWNEPELILPHPRMHERRFVLEPLAEIAPDAIHPVRNKTIQELLEELRATAPPGRELTGQKALVTGSTSGIGRAIAIELARAGADVIVHGRRSQVTAESVAEEIDAIGSGSLVMLADLRNPEQRQMLIETAWNEWEGLDIWVNNAGADTLTGEAAHWPFEQKLQELLGVDLMATMLLSRDVGTRMKAAGRGVIVNIGWDQADTGMEGDSGQLFGATKAAVMSFTKSLALSLAPEVRVNCVAPGWIRTAWGGRASEIWQERVRRETPLRRWGSPEDVAKTIRWLVSPAAEYVTGQIIRVNGGAVR